MQSLKQTHMQPASITSVWRFHPGPQVSVVPTGENCDPSEQYSTHMHIISRKKSNQIFEHVLTRS